MILDLIIGLVALTLGVALGRARRPARYPATRRQLARAQRTNRLRQPAHDQRQWIPLPNGHFSDDEETK